MRRALAAFPAAAAVLGISVAVFSQQDPEPPKPNREAGKRLFAAKCTMCHGKDGRGNKALAVPPLDDPKVVKQYDSPQKLRQAVLQGIQPKAGQRVAMPAYGGKLKPNEIDDVIVFTFSLQTGRKTYRAKCLTCHGKDGAGNKALGVPALNDPKVVKEYDTSEKLKKAILEGVKPEEGNKVAMPAYSSKLKAKEVDGLVAYIWQLQHPKKEPESK